MAMSLGGGFFLVDSLQQKEVRARKLALHARKLAKSVSKIAVTEIWPVFRAFFFAVRAAIHRQNTLFRPKKTFFSDEATYDTIAPCTIGTVVICSKHPS
jgi:hypothetical protein